MDTDIRSCDLHCMTLDKAKIKVVEFLNACIREKIHTAKIITGKDGHGNEPVLMTEIPRYVLSLGVRIEYPDISDESGNLEKGSFTVNLDDIILHFESQDSEETRGAGLIDAEFIERFKNRKEKTPTNKPVLEITPEPKQAVVRQTKVDLLNIVVDNSFCYNVLLRTGRKEEWVKCQSASEVRSILADKGIVLSKKWDQELLVWEKKENLWRESQPKKFARYKGHTKRK